MSNVQDDRLKEKSGRETEHVEHDVAGEETKNVSQMDKNVDLANEFLATHGGSRPITDEENRRVLRKIDMRLLPIMWTIYTFQQLDRSTLANTSVFDLTSGAHLHGQEYAWLGSIVYFAMLFFQPLSNFALVRVPVHRWVILSCSAAATNWPALMVVRFLLGMFEASIGPSFIILTTMWWSRREQALRMNLWYACNGLSGVLGALISYGFGHLKHHSIYLYQIIFLFCGLLTFVVAIPLTLLFPSRPSSASFLTEDEKRIAIERVRHNNTGTQNQVFKWSHVREAFLDIKMYLYMLQAFCIGILTGGLGTFQPLILKGFGLSVFDSLLYSALSGGVSIGVNAVSGIIASKIKHKSIVVAGLQSVTLAGCIALYVLPRGKQYTKTLLGVYYLTQFVQAANPITFSWCAANTAGHTKKATMTVLLWIGFTVSNIVGPLLYKSTESPFYFSGLKANMICVGAQEVLIGLTCLVVWNLNRQNKNRRRARGMTGDVQDLSLASSKGWEKMRAKQKIVDETEGGNTDHHTQAFLDLTDRQNEEFIYSY